MEMYTANNEQLSRHDRRWRDASATNSKYFPHPGLKSAVGGKWTLEKVQFVWGFIAFCRGD